jgi:hypothetical protein
MRVMMLLTHILMIRVLAPEQKDLAAERKACHTTTKVESSCGNVA